MTIRLIVALAAALSCCFASVPATAETVLETFPLLVEAGRPTDAGPSSEALRETGVTFLADVPFSLESGYGYVGGAAGERTGARALDGGPDRPLVWREGVEKYMFRVPRGEYLVALTFVETEVGQPGLRVFDIAAEGGELFPAVDPCRLAGDFAWMTLQERVSVYDGWLDLRFTPHDDSRPARISRVRLARWEEAEAAARAVTSRTPPVSELAALGGPGCNVLSWSPRLEPGVAGYGVFRSESADGPFRSVSAGPVMSSSYVDHHVVVGRTCHYRVCVYAVGGTQSVFSHTVEAAAKRPEELGLPVYNLRLPLEDLRRIGARDAGGVQVAAELVHLGSVYHVTVSHDASLGRWQRKKSFQVEVDRDRSRLFERRSQFYLDAEAGDTSFMRALLSQEAHRTLGLAAPQVEAVVLMVNNRFEGVYLDREHVGVRFRRRARLESRSGLLAELTRGDHLRMDWKPYGEKIGEPGNIFGLTWFIQELNRLGTGEAGDFLESRLYLDRSIDRLALAAIAGGEGSPVGSLLLEDSRNRKWEWFCERSASGEWGIDDFGPIRVDPAPEEVAAALTRGTLHGARAGDASWSVLATRVWNQPALRERLLARIDDLISGKLAPEVLDGVIDRISSAVRGAVRVDPHQALHRFEDTSPDGPPTDDTPARLKAAYRARVALLRTVVSDARAAAPPSVILNEVLLRPAEGPPWIELRNRGDVDLPLDGYSLSTGPGQPGARLAGTIPARGCFRWGLEEDSPLFPASGGRICLYSSRSPGPRDGTSATEGRLVDLLFYGHQTEGVPYGRKPDTGAWGFLAGPTPAAENEARELLPPPYSFRSSAELEKDGSVMLWMLPRVARTGFEERPEEVSLVHREEGDSDFQRVGLRWDESRHQFLIGLKKEEKPRRTDYYLLARSPDGVERAYPLAGPELLLTIPVLPPLEINEVLPRPDRRESEAQREFIEIRNPTDEPIDLEGMYLSDRRTLPAKWRIPAGSTAPPRGYLVFYTRGEEPGRNVDFSLSNSGEFLGLFGRIEEGNLPIDTIGFRGVRAGESWGRTEDGTKSFRAWKDPTPGARNMPKIPEELLRKNRDEP